MSNPPPTSLYPALLAAMRAMGPVRKNAVNPHLKSKYADLTSVIDAIEGPLWDNGLIVVQRFGHDEHGPILFTELIHAATGERIISSVPVVSKDPTDPQKMGGAITYYRRYSLLALLGLAPEDDDGHAASQPTPPARPARSQPQSPDPRPAAVTPAAGSPPSTDPYTKEQYEAVVAEAWVKVANGETYPELVSFMRTHRDRFTPDQYDDSVEEMRKLRKAIAGESAA